MKKSTTLTWVLIGLAIIIAAFPMFFNLGDPNSEEQNPDYKPWFSPLVGELPPEVESGLFALQAALGAGFLGYALGTYRGRNKALRDSEKGSEQG